PLVRGTKPPPKKQRMEVVRIKTQEPEMLVIVSKCIWGQPVHWFGRRSHECTQDRGRCKGCEENWPCKWQGYLHVTNHTLSWNGFLELTALAWGILLSQVRVGENLRGSIIKVSRTKGGPRGRYMIEVLERRIADDALPEERDPLQ